MIGKILLSLLIGALTGGCAYVVIGVLRRSGSEDGKGAGGSKNPARAQTKAKRLRPTDGDDTADGGQKNSDLTPTKEWFGGFRG